MNRVNLDKEELKQKIANLTDKTYSRGYDDGWHKGYDTGYNKAIRLKDDLYNEALEKGKIEGMQELFEVIKTILDKKAEDLLEIFGSEQLVDILDEYKPQTIVEKIKEEAYGHNTEN